MKKALLLLLLFCLILAGCTEGTNDVREEIQTYEEPDTVILSAETTVLDLKKKYGTDSNKSIMPLYNVDYDHVFSFGFNSDFSGILPSDVVSIHTDIKVLDESKVLAFASFEDLYSEKDTIEIRPSVGVLSSSDTKHQFDAGWGNAPIFYIRVNYDMDAETPTKLDEPVVIPFTIKTDVPVPTLKYEIASNGQLKLKWDAVEGAKEYKVYQTSNPVIFEISNVPLSGAEGAYARQYPRLLATVTETEFDDFMRDGTGGISVVSSSSPELFDATSYQNRMVEGEYYVTAVDADGNESNFSKAMETYGLSKMLPSEMTDETFISFSYYDSVKDLPKTVDVIFIDGSIAKRNVKFDVTGIEPAEYGSTHINYTVEGTAFKGYLWLKNVTQDELDALANASVADSVKGFVEPENKIDHVPSPDVPTIIEASPTDSAIEEPRSDSLVDKQKENTEKQVSEGNKQPVAAPESVKDVPVNADSALEEYLALAMIDGQTEISMKAFPESQNFDALADVLQKVTYQNPLILGVRQYAYSYGDLTLMINYDYTRDEILRMQQEIVEEAAKLVSEIITQDMTADQKRLAIYDYLNDNTEYDIAALESAEKNNFQSVDSSFNDSFTTYGIMVKKIGVCASYAATYKMLSDLAGLESIVVTGTVGGVPHAWNKVKLESGWVHVDPTNNATNSGIPYLLYNSSDEIASNTDYILDDAYWLDTELTQFDSNDNSNDYYIMNGLEVGSINELTAKLESNMKNGEWTTVVRYVGLVDSDALYNGVGETVMKIAEDRLDSTVLGSLGPYIVIISE